MVAQMGHARSAATPPRWGGPGGTLWSHLFGRRVIGHAWDELMINRIVRR